MFNWAFIQEVGPVRWFWRTLKRQISKRLLGRDNTITLPTGLKMVLPRKNHFASEVYVTNCSVDWGTEKIFADHLDKSGVFLDIGAHIGYYSLYILPCVSTVYAFEPDPRMQPFLESNLKPYPSIHMVPKAVGSKSGSMQFHLSSEPATSHIVKDLSLLSNQIAVETVTVDDFIEQSKLPVTGIKIDVEGFDMEVLYGSQKTIEKYQPLIITEARPNEELFSFANKIGYSVFAFVKNHSEQKLNFRMLEYNKDILTKMVFLVPQRCVSHFVKLVG